MAKPVCVVLGSGPGNGMSCARRFLDAGYAVAICARDGERMDQDAKSLGPNAFGYSIDVTDDTSVTDGISAIVRDIGPVDTLIYNAGSARWGNIDDLEVADVFPGIDVNVAGLVRAAKSVLPTMRAAARGNILVIGAGAALRGRPGTLAFAAAKAAQRSVTQSLARQLGPEGIHVAYLVLDGVVDLESTRERMSDKPKTYFLTADGVADAAFMLSTQDRQAWTFELDLRPFGEDW
ncbi:MAG: SDR family NAD(P)-dependent oxidoreductase [Boseongicola sp.]